MLLLLLSSLRLLLLLAALKSRGVPVRKTRRGRRSCSSSSPRLYLCAHTGGTALSRGLHTGG